MRRNAHFRFFRVAEKAERIQKHRLTAVLFFDVVPDQISPAET